MRFAGRLPRRSGEVGMTWRHILLAASLVLASPAVAADQASIRDFAGDWRGVEVTKNDQALAATPQDLDLRLSPESDGFRLSWIRFSRAPDGGLEREKAEASFAPTDRPGVFAFRPGPTSLLDRLFGDPATANPIDGKTLLWARLDGATLTVYSLSIDDHGRFDLNRYARTLADHQMSLQYTRRSENDVILTLEGRLEKAGG
jgi:hypothetical protein